VVFSSPIFLFLFLPTVLFGYFLTPRRFRNAWLLVFSLLFYAWGEGLLVLLLAGSAVMNHYLGRAMDRTADARGRKRLLAVAVAANLLPLGAYKYTNFLVENVNAVAHALGLAGIPQTHIHLPIGISFYTFQALSYVIDLYYRRVELQKRPADLMLYLALFPQLIAGPIVRYKDVAAQLVRRSVALRDFGIGIERFVIGLAKKALLANTFAVAADGIFALPPHEVTGPVAWFGTFAYFLQVYFDFSGYSDMAIGLGRMFGFHFLENFNYPYISQSITEFWQRWHISLSTWLRDYLYIPLGGSRVAPWKVYRNLVVVFLLCGLWHGAAWTFVIFGGVHGAYLILERLPTGRALRAAPRPLRHVYFLLAFVLSLVIFRSESLTQAGLFFRAMFGFAGDVVTTHHTGEWLDNRFRVMLWVGVIGATPIVPWLRSLRRRRIEAGGAAARVLRLAGDYAGATLLLALYAASAINLASTAHNPFIYFRF